MRNFPPYTSYSSKMTSLIIIKIFKSSVLLTKNDSSYCNVVDTIYYRFNSSLSIMSIYK